MLKGFFLVMTALGLATAAFGIYFIFYSNEARSWPSVQGEVVGTTVRTYTARAGSVTTSRDRERLRSFYPAITYRWTVDGRSYQGSRYSLGEAHDDYPERAEAEQAAATYPAGGPIAVFYDPADPASAVLDRSQQGGAFVPLPLGLLMLAIGVFGLKKLPQIQAAAAHADPVAID